MPLVSLLPTSAASAPVPAQRGAAASLDLSQSASQPTAATGQDFIFFLTWSCAPLTTPCEGATITDTLPPQLSRAAADVQFSGNFADVAYNPATGTAVFTLFSPLPAGTTAQVAITARFPSGTPQGTSTTNVATIQALNAFPVESNPVTVTAIAAPSWVVTKGRVTGVAQLNTSFTYRVGLTLTAAGTRTVSNARLVDTLPPGAVFVAATQGGTDNPTTNEVTWALGTLTPDPTADTTTSREVTVVFPDPTFEAGDSPVNSVEGFGAPAGDEDRSLGSAEFPVALQPAGLVVGGTKTTTLEVLANGQWDTYAVTGSNPNAVGLDAFTVHEELPVALTMVQDGAPNVLGPGVAPQVSWRPLGGGAFQPAATTSSMGGTWTATLPASADEIRLDYGRVPAGFQASAQLRAGLPLSGIGRDGAPIVAGSTVRNCVTTTGVAGDGAGLFRSTCTDQQAEAVAVSFAKARTSAASVLPGARSPGAWTCG